FATRQRSQARATTEQPSRQPRACKLQGVGEKHTAVRRNHPGNPLTSSPGAVQSPPGPYEQATVETHATMRLRLRSYQADGALRVGGVLLRKHLVKPRSSHTQLRPRCGNTAARDARKT